jgi:hypothetical protein
MNEDYSNNTFGPSKEELQRYWVSNREHFDSLAKYYKEKDHKYYDEFIAPFYNEQPVATKVKTKSRASLMVIIIAIMVVFIAGAGMLVFFMLSNQVSKVERNVIKVESNDSVDVKNNENDKVYDYDSDSHYIQGLMYLSKKKYDEAEYHLKLVPKGDPDYKSAQQVLESIKYLKKYDKK